MDKNHEVDEIFKALRAFAQKNKGEFLCMVRYPVMSGRWISHFDPVPIDSYVFEALMMGPQSSQIMSKEVSIIFKTLRDFAWKNNAVFLCKVRYPIAGKPEFFSEHQGDLGRLIRDLSNHYGVELKSTR
jgi:hypothetical protein